MADGPGLALQKALIAVLRANAGVSALVGARVYDEPPQAVTFPFVRLGNIDLSPERLSCVDDHSIAFSVEAHSRPTSGRVEAARIADAIRAALNDQEAAITAAMTGYSADWCTYTTQTATRAADGESYVAIVAFEAALAG